MPIMPTMYYEVEFAKRSLNPAEWDERWEDGWEGEYYELVRADTSEEDFQRFVSLYIEAQERAHPGTEWKLAWDMRWISDYAFGEDGEPWDGERPVKDWDAFESGEGICYVTESGAGYTRGHFLALVDGDADTATRLFSLCEWQAPETLLDEDHEGALGPRGSGGQWALKNGWNGTGDLVEWLEEHS